MRATFALLLALTGVARADPDDETSRFTMQVGLAGRVWHDRSLKNDKTFDITPESGKAGALQLMSGARVSPGLSLGVRMVVSWERYIISSFVNHDLEQFTVVPVDMAASALFETEGFWVSPWIGWHTQSTRGTEKNCVAAVCENNPMLDIPGSWASGSLGFGWLVGVDLVHYDHGHHHDRLGLFLEVEGTSADYFSVGLGVSYRRR